MNWHDAMVLKELDSALLKTMKEDEFREEIERLKLRPGDVTKNLSRSRPLLAAARELSKSAAAVDADVERHRREKPVWWPRSWRPAAAEVRFLVLGASTLLGWLALLVVFGGFVPGFVFTVTGTVALAISTGFAAMGLPVEFLNAVRWTADFATLALAGSTERRDLRQRMRNEVVRPALRKWLSSQMTPLFTVVLELRNADQLSLPAGEGPLVETAAVAACVREVNRSRPGAVGLAGPRGVGKSTIINRALDNQFTDESRQPMLGVLTSAPVRYDARDFVLHLHACVCRAVLDHLTPDQSGSETRRQWLRVLGRHQLRERVADVAKDVLRCAVWALAALGFAGLAWGWRDDVPALVRAGAAFASALKSDVGGFVSTVDLRGVAAVLALYASFRAAWALWCLTGWPVVAGLAAAAWRRAFGTSRPKRREPAIAALHAVAEQHLRQIRFLQTHTSGWSGKVSAPIGSELGWTRSLAKTEQPWTHPEVVDRLRDFLALVVEVLVDGYGRLSGVAIAIDELDKIGDPEEARRFLNEIKGVFGIPHCLFLVSMSDDALTAFERRGIPVRDAFDSAFTTMIDVRPFTLDESRDWLARRALGIPEPFVWLCHCLSGGLPRDLGRTAIVLHDLYEQQNRKLRLADAARSLVRRDLDLKIRAFTHTARRITPGGAEAIDQSQSLIEALQRTTVADVGRLLPRALEIRKWSVDGEPTAVTELSAEAACYILFCQTVTDVFDTSSEPQRLKRLAARIDPHEPGALAVELATARQQMSIDPTLAWNHLADFRKALADD
ncbi:hypothetical protein [Saccharothrix obliqua]|uniref:hypothetical protein n=1 Tax=Saccharothrix obliqua TaxID=2861747 RepID=UPI001C5DA799|nr:hypothetical protein [Saccharothrix obliqua]MBW4722168.1 hypothetical protein [Saccharothrix obliqua]